MSHRTRHEAEWTRDELAFIDANLDMSVSELARALGKSAIVVSRARARIESPSLSDPWTVEDDEFLASTPNLTAAQVANRLGRSIGSVTNRRQLLVRTRGLKFADRHGTNKSPFHVGARPLIAKTCTKCGLLLPSEWFSWLPRQNGTGGWLSSCRKCQAGSTADWHERTGPKARDKRKHATGSRLSRRRLQEMTVPRAERGGEPWLDSDHEVLRDPDLTLLEKALKLKRSYNAVSIACSSAGYRSHVGLGSAERDLWVIDNPNEAKVA